MHSLTIVYVVSTLAAAQIAFSAPLSNDISSAVRARTIETTHFQKHVPRAKAANPPKIVKAKTVPVTFSAKTRPNRLDAAQKAGEHYQALHKFGLAPVFTPPPSPGPHPEFNIFSDGSFQKDPR
ncbi:hypothetical protein K439DRAFT_1643498 [Ramaria rubella]|nr:hypothetical protein K439DRAFT_1643498 [Ramaria rubella]